jgi:hypothetical protein
MPLHFATLEVLDNKPTLIQHLADGIAKNVEATASIVVLQEAVRQGVAGLRVVAPLRMVERGNARRRYWRLTITQQVSQEGELHAILGRIGRMQLHPHTFEILHREAVLDQSFGAWLPEERLTIIAVKERQELALDVVAGPGEVATACHTSTLGLSRSSLKRAQSLQHTEDGQDS